MAEAQPVLPRRWLRRSVRCGLWVAMPWLAAVVLGMNPSTPIDYVMNVWPAPFEAGLVVPPDGARHLVVLQHGLWRSAGAMWKLERALRAHGYEVLNFSYPSTACMIEEHAEHLRAELEERLAPPDPRPLHLHFVGHSLGGLVIRAYLRQPFARPADDVVFLGTPQRGAILCDLRRQYWVFRVLMRDRAAPQLSPSSAFVRDLPVPSFRFATIAGGSGDDAGRNPQIPGDDDGTVAVAETVIPGCADCLVMPIGHTRLSFHDDVIVQVLSYLRTGKFRR